MKIIFNIFKYLNIVKNIKFNLILKIVNIIFIIIHKIIDF